MNHQTDNPEKGQLLEKSVHHRELLNEDVKLITEKTERIFTNALIIGGTLTAAYWLVRSFSRSSKPRKRKSARLKIVEPRPDSDRQAEVVEDDARSEAGVVSQIGSVLVAQATGFLLSIAKEKLVEFLQSQAVKKDKNDAHS